MTGVDRSPLPLQCVYFDTTLSFGGFAYFTTANAWLSLLRLLCHLENINIVFSKNKKFIISKK